jgi:uncharacterized protein YkwD
MRAGTIAVVAAVAVAALVIRVSSFTGRPAMPALGADEFGAAESLTVKLINDARLRAGVSPLVVSNRLLLAARVHSNDMAADDDLAHESMIGDAPVDRVRSAGLDYEELAENLFKDSGPDVDKLPERAIEDWLESPTPRANLLSPRFRTAAVAIARAVDGSFFVTLDLMR